MQQAVRLQELLRGAGDTHASMHRIKVLGSQPDPMGARVGLYPLHRKTRTHAEDSARSVCRDGEMELLRPIQGDADVRWQR